MPFKALLLQPCKLSNAVDTATAGLNVFIKIQDDIKTFYALPKGAEKGNGEDNERGERDGNPVWEEMFAESLGAFDPLNLTLRVARLSWDGSRRLSDVPGTEPGVISRWSEAKLVSQLRYEYALNLMNRIGTAVTRIGLDFID